MMDTDATGKTVANELPIDLGLPPLYFIGVGVAMVALGGRFLDQGIKQLGGKGSLVQLAKRVEAVGPLLGGEHASQLDSST